jgi:hypothetical protein
LAVEEAAMGVWVRGLVVLVADARRAAIEGASRTLWVSKWSGVGCAPKEEAGGEEVGEWSKVQGPRGGLTLDALWLTDRHKAVSAN